MESSANVRFPQMRNEILEAVEALADPDYQERVWIRRDTPKPLTYDDFQLRIHILYDDTTVLEDPDAAVGDLLRSQAEADALHPLAKALDTVGPSAIRQRITCGRRDGPPSPQPPSTPSEC